MFASFRVGALCLAALLLAACSLPADVVLPPTLPDTDAVIDPVTDLPALPANTWTKLAGPAGCMCSDGSPYAFYARPGKVNKLVVYFEGGGACWSDGTCNKGELYQANLTETSAAKLTAGQLSGIFAPDNAENPVKDWYQVFIPYCTADVHLGDNVMTYQTPTGPKTIYHVGQRNAGAVLRWIGENFAAPEEILVTGSSAGAYGAALYAPRLDSMYPRARVTELGDAGAGIMPASFAKTGLANWKIDALLPPGVSVSGTGSNFLTRAYISIGLLHADMRLAQYTSAADGVQIGFYALMEGVSLDDSAGLQRAGSRWAEGLAASYGLLNGALRNFSSYISLDDEDGTLENGSAHTILWRPELYTLETAGTPFLSWLEALLSGADVPALVVPQNLPAPYNLRQAPASMLPSKR